MNTTPKTQMPAIKTAQDVKTMQQDKTLQTLARAVFMAMAYAQTVREVIEPEQQKMVDFFKFKVAEGSRMADEGDIITKPKHLYLASESDWKLFDDEMKRIYVAVNILPTKEGNCPLLESESLEREAKREFINALEYYTGLSANRLLCSGIKNYEKYINLNLSLFASKA